MPETHFIDSHCHLFNMQDIPLFATLAAAAERVNTLCVLVAALAGVHRRIGTYRDFVLFFEGRIADNIKWLVDQIKEARPDGETILTPLVVDYERISPPKREVALQVKHLLSAIREKRTYLKKNNCKILPFVGYDLRKLKDGDGLDGFAKLWEQKDWVLDKETRRDFAKLKSGNVIGIKLYPPIGFNPYPRKGTRLHDLCMQFYHWCADPEHDVPITVHCQKGSYSTADQRSVEANTNPKNWEKVLEPKKLKSLRVNFAHFGGEEDLADTVFPPAEPGKPKLSRLRQDLKRFKKSTWAYTIMRILKKYENTYADISAFNFTDTCAARALARVLSLDEEGDLDERLRIDSGKYRLKDKLLWGSDVPMPISHRVYREDNDDDGEGHYKYLYQTFRNSLEKAGLDAATLDDIDTALTCTNPKRFLFGV